MNKEDVNWAIDTIRTCEEDMLDEKTRLRRVNDRERAMRIDGWSRQLFGIRQLLETERNVLTRLKT